jgi:hypothetical protein
MQSFCTFLLHGRCQSNESNGATTTLRTPVQYFSKPLIGFRQSGSVGGRLDNNDAMTKPNGECEKEGQMTAAMSLAVERHP